MSEEIALCECCKQLQNLDRVLASTFELPIAHHKSWTELCQSARYGCRLCDTFVRCQDYKCKALSIDFDEQHVSSNTQLFFWRHAESEELFVLQQTMWEIPIKDKIDIWMELYTHSGE